MPDYGKLVRDRIPEILEAQGIHFETRLLAPDERRPALYAKLVEELAELEAASDPVDVAAEIADLLEVVYALADEAGIDRVELEQLRQRKAAERGGFRDGVLLIRVVSGES